MVKTDAALRELKATKDLISSLPLPSGIDHYLVPVEVHNQLVRLVFRKRGYTEVEANDMSRLAAAAARHGIKTHNALKAIHLEDLFGSKVGGCVPGAEIERLPGRFEAAECWDAHKKLGASVAYRAVERCAELANRFGIGTVAVDNAWHYLWGGAFALEFAAKGLIGYTNCTAMLAEVVPHGGSFPTLGTNPHTWAFPTQEIAGFDLLIDFATSAIAMGRVQQLAREGGKLPANAALDELGAPTIEPASAAALLPFGGHKGYGLGLIDELIAGFIGGFLPTVRGRFHLNGHKHTPCFFFCAIHPDAISSNRYHHGRSRAENLKAILEDIRGHGNESALLPGQPEASYAARTERAGGLIFTRFEAAAFEKIAASIGFKGWTTQVYTE